MDKQLIKLRIEELKFRKEEYSPYDLSTYLTILFGFTSILFVIVSYFAKKGDLGRIFWFLKIYFGVIIFTYIVVFIGVGRKKGRINKAIQNNYDLLLGRTKVKPNVWKKRMLK